MISPSSTLRTINLRRILWTDPRFLQSTMAASTPQGVKQSVFLTCFFLFFWTQTFQQEEDGRWKVHLFYQSRSLLVYLNFLFPWSFLAVRAYYDRCSDVRKMRRKYPADFLFHQDDGRKRRWFSLNYQEHVTFTVPLFRQKGNQSTTERIACVFDSQFPAENIFWLYFRFHLIDWNYCTTLTQSILRC